MLRLLWIQIVDVLTCPTFVLIIIAGTPATAQSDQQHLKVAGRIVDGESSVPLTGFTMYAAVPNSVIVEKSRLDVECENGVFRIEGYAGSIRWGLIRAPGYASQLVDFREAKSVSGADMVVQMYRGGTVFGKVTAEEGLPISNARIGLLTKDGRPFYSLVTMMPSGFVCGTPTPVTLLQDCPWGSFLCESISDLSGSWDIDRIPAGVYRLVVEARGFAQHISSPFELNNNAVARLMVKLLPECRLTVRVSSPAAMALSSPLVLLNSVEDSVRTSPVLCWYSPVLWGNVEFLSVPPGKYSVSVIPQVRDPREELSGATIANMFLATKTFVLNKGERLTLDI